MSPAHDGDAFGFIFGQWKEVEALQPSLFRSVTVIDCGILGKKLKIDFHQSFANKDYVTESYNKFTAQTISI